MKFSIDLTEEQKQELHNLMVSVNSFLKPLSQKMFGERSLRKMRDEVRAGKVDLPPKESEQLNALMRSEELIIAGYIRIAAPLVKSFSFTAKFEHEDLWQEAALVVYNAIYSFDGSSEFSTYVYWTVKNHFLSKVKSQKKCVQTVSGLTTKDGKEIDIAVNPACDLAVKVQEAQEFIKNAPLTDRERETIDYCLKDGDEGWQTRFAIKSNLTKQRVHQLYKSSKEKIVRYTRLAA